MNSRRLFVLLLAIALFVMSVRETIDPDIWWHLRTGEAVWQDGLPQYDLFSFTVPDHEWIVQQWLTDVFMWLVYTFAGLSGLSIVFASIITAAFMLVYRRCAGRPYLAAFVVLLAFFSAALPLGARPQMFNMLFLAAFVYIIEGVKDGELNRRALFVLPFITILWANMHSGYLSGVALLAAYIVGESLQRWWGQSDARTLPWSGIGRLAAITVVALLSSLINPRGYRLWLFPLYTLSSDAIQSNISEWHSPDFHLIYFWFFGLMMAVGVLSWVFSRQRPTWTELLLFFGPATAGLVSARHIPLFAIVAAPTVARHLLSSFQGTHFHPLLSGRRLSTPVRRPMIVLNWGVLLLVLVAAVIWVDSRLRTNEETIAERFPVAAIDFVEREELDDGRVYNDYEWGGYLIWRRIPVFIDGRTELYGNEFFSYYLQTIRLRQGWRQPLDDFSVDYVMVRRDHPLATLLLTSGEWRAAYADEVAHVLVRE